MDQTAIGLETSPGFKYHRRQPEESILYGVVQDFYPAFLSAANQVGKTVPKFVRREFEKYLACGILENGFVRVYCHQCRHEKVVAFSCKCRGFCPSCTARRMNDLAFHIVNKVLPEKVDVRQWVLSMPYTVRFVLAHKPKVTCKVLKIFTRTISAWLKNKAKHELSISAQDLKTGAITFIQKAGDAANANTHFHTLFCSGVCYEKDGKWLWHVVEGPTPEEQKQLVVKLMLKIDAYLKSKDLLSEDGFGQLDFDDQILSDITAAAIQHKSFLDSTAQKKPGFSRMQANVKTSKSGGVSIHGYSLHCGVRIRGHKRGKIEKLLRYMARGPIALERFKQMTSDEKIIYKLKTPWDHGDTVTESVSFTPIELIERLAAIIPPPNANLVIYSGVLAPNCKIRDKVVPYKKPPQPENPEVKTGDDRTSKPPSQQRMLWTQMLQHVFKIDVLHCDKCSGRMEQIAYINDPLIAKKILRHMGLTSERAPPENEVRSTVDFHSQDYSQEVNW